MSEGTSISVGNLAGLSKPAALLIEKVSNAVGGLCAPWQIKRIAKAETEAAIIKAQGEIQITDLQRRAMHRFLDEEAKRQQNIESITAKALPELKENADPQKVDDDWITNFFDKCRIVSDEDMQNLWAKILAGEANTPGTYSKRTVNLLADLDKNDAEMFCKLSQFAWSIPDVNNNENITPIILNHNLGFYKENEVDFDFLNHLEAIGLIKVDASGGFSVINLSKEFTVFYFKKPLKLTSKKDSNHTCWIGSVVLTKVGLELFNICERRPIDGFYEFAKETWAMYAQSPNTDPAI